MADALVQLGSPDLDEDGLLEEICKQGPAGVLQPGVRDYMNDRTQCTVALLGYPYVLAKGNGGGRWH
jgi:hypothetical protein